MVPLSKLHSFPHRFDYRGVDPHHQPPAKPGLPWDSWAALGLGVAIGVSPWSFRFTGLDYATLNAVIIGMLVFALSALTLTLKDRWESWVNLGLGGWLAISPWLLGYHSFATAALPHLLLGLAVMLLSIAGLWRHWGEREPET